MLLFGGFRSVYFILIGVGMSTLMDIHMGHVHHSKYLVTNLVHTNCRVLAHSSLAVFGTGHSQYRRRYM